MSEQVARKVCSWCPHAERSKEHHNFFFAVCATAYKNWPETHAFQPNNAEHLRAWMLVEIGWFQEIDVNLTELAGAKAIAERATVLAIKSASRLLDKPVIKIIRTDTGVKLIAPKSIARAKCSAKDYDWICEKGVNELAHHVGVPVDLLRQEGRKAQKGKAA